MIISLSPSDNPLVMLLRKYDEEKQADDAIKGPLTELNLRHCPIGDD